MTTEIFTSERQLIEHLIQVKIKTQHFFLKNYMFCATRSQMVAVVGQTLISNVIPSSSKHPEEYQVLSQLSYDIGVLFLERNKNHEIIVLEGNPGDVYSNIVVHIEKY